MQSVQTKTQPKLDYCNTSDSQSDARCRRLRTHTDKHAGPDGTGKWRQWGRVHGA